MLNFALADDCAGERLDKLLPELAGLSRSRLAGLVAAGQVRVNGVVLTDGKRKAKGGEVIEILVPPPEEIAPLPEAIPLTVAYEDAELIVIDKPAGMTVHPAPGHPNGTLVNALLHHCGESLSGIGGARRPGIVHRIDKETSGLLVVAKTDRAHQHLQAHFARHSIEREYLAVVLGVPARTTARLMGNKAVSIDEGWLKIDAPIGRHPLDRLKMAVVNQGGRHAITRVQVVESFGVPARASLLRCRLETGRTHQIRVHLAHVGHPLLGDPVYGRGQGALPPFARQALHAAVLGFEHPVTGQMLRFETPPPPDFRDLLDTLRHLPAKD